MNFREATVNDIDNYMVVRMSVKENVLNNPALVTKEDNVAYFETKFKMNLRTSQQLIDSHAKFIF